jgi:hypothetical protein
MAVIGLGSAYPIAANLFLGLGGIRLMLASTDEVQVEFRKAWSFWPGVIHAEDIRIHFQDRNVQMLLVLSHADVNVRISELVHRRIHATRVRGSGVVLRFRHRIQPESAGAPYVAAFPPVPPLEDPPLFEAGPPTPPLDEANYNLWTVQMEDVDVQVRELWAQMFRYQGEARVRGAFRLRPAKRVWVGPAELDLLGGSLTTGPHDVLRAMEGTVTCQVDDFDVEPVHGMAPFHFISARVKMSAQVPGLTAANYLAGPSRPVRLEDGSGAVDVDAAIDHGVVTPDTRVVYRTNHVGMTTDVIALHVDGDVAVSAHGGTAAPHGHLVLEIPAALLQLRGTTHGPLQLKGIHASAAMTDVDVTADPSFAGGRLHFDRLGLADLGWLNDLPGAHSRKWKVEKGRGWAGGTITLSPGGEVQGSLTAGIQDAQGKVAALHLRGTAEAAVTLESRARSEGRIRGRIAAGPLKISSDDGVQSEFVSAELVGAASYRAKGATTGQIHVKTDAWFGRLSTTRISGSSLSIDLQLDASSIRGGLQARDLRASAVGTCPWAEIGTLSLDGEVHAPKAGPVTGTAGAVLDGTSMKWGQFSVAAGRTTIVGAWDENSLAARMEASSLALKNAGGPPKSWQADVGSTSIDAKFAMTGGKMAGPVRFEARALRGVVGKTRIGGDIIAQLDVRSGDDAHRIADVAGVVQARAVALSNERFKVDDWWAQFNVDGMHVDTRRDFDFAGKVQARVRDALPVLNILASEDEIPKWVPSVLPLQGIALDLAVERYCRWTDLQIAGATGGPLSAQGRVQTEPGETRGAILLRLASFKPLSVGLDFVEDYSDSSVLAGSGWLEQHLSTLTSAATEKHDAQCEPQPPQCE